MTTSMDPRIATIEKRLAGVSRIVAVTGGKGGIGKSLVASTLALVLVERGKRVGLLDLDLTGPCDHIILGLDAPFPEEKFGLEPPLVQGLRFMSVTHFTGDNPAPLRGQDVSNALIELLTITQWGELDLLVIDMPPGIGDAALDAVRLLRRAEYMVVSTASRVVIETVDKTLRLLQRLGPALLGVVENMQRDESSAVRDLARAAGVSYLGSLPFDPTVEQAVGDATRLAATPVAAAVREVATRLDGPT
jgi:ATP-binding protein involved in chromosome partitioning